MTHSPTLDPERLDQLRTFLTAEAAAQAADSQRRALVASHPRRLIVGAVAAMALSGMFAVSLLPGGTDAALAITTEGEWTTVRLADVDADARAVVDQLVAAGIDARLASRWDPNAPQGVGMMMLVVSDSSLGDLGYGLSIVVPVGPGPTSRAEPADEPPPPDPGPVDVVADDPDLFELHGVRQEGEDGSFSIRSGSDAIVLVHPRE